MHGNVYILDLIKAIFSNDERFIVSSSYGKTVKLWNVNNGKMFKTFRGHSNIVFGIALSPDNKGLHPALKIQ